MSGMTQADGAAAEGASGAGRTVLVAGATGVVGTAAVEHYAAHGWQVLALSRRPPSTLPDGVVHLAADLADAASVRAIAARLAPVSHLFYAALYEKPDLIAGWRDSEQMQTNERMLRHLLDALDGVASGLQHVTVLQGTKAYGSHLGPVNLPLKERWPRHQHANFYWLQEDLVRERAARCGWHFTVLRPQLVLGHSTGGPMNALAALGAYVAVMRELGQAPAYPGGPRTVNGASDSRLIAAAAEFAGTHAVARNETYNVVNGDVLVWPDIWPSITACFGVAPGVPQRTRLADVMPAHEAVWARLVDRHGLQKLSLAQLVGSSWQFVDRSLATDIEAPTPAVMSSIKLWQAGFHQVLDTEDAIGWWLKRLQQQRLLPT